MTTKELESLITAQNGVIAALCSLLIEKKVATPDEIRAKLEPVMLNSDEPAASAVQVLMLGLGRVRR